MFERVAGGVAALVSYGSVLRPVGEFARESQSRDKAVGKIAPDSELPSQCLAKRAFRDGSGDQHRGWIV